MQATRGRLGAKPVGAVLIVESLLLFVPVVILGSAIDWPASLSRPADVVLPLIAARSGAVTAGYFSYLVYSILFFPMAYLLSGLRRRGAYRERRRTDRRRLRRAVDLSAFDRDRTLADGHAHTRRAVGGASRPATSRSPTTRSTPLPAASASR